MGKLEQWRAAVDELVAGLRSKYGTDHVHHVEGENVEGDAVVVRGLRVAVAHDEQRTGDGWRYPSRSTGRWLLKLSISEGFDRDRKTLPEKNDGTYSVDKALSWAIFHVDEALKRRETAKKRNAHSAKVLDVVKGKIVGQTAGTAQLSGITVRGAAYVSAHTTPRPCPARLEVQGSDEQILHVVRLLADAGVLEKAGKS